MNKSPHKWAIWLLICTEAAIGYYHELSRKLITNSNLTADSYFGYSVTYQTNIKRLIVGAPKANVTGQVYTVDIESGNITLLDTPKIISDHLNALESPDVTHKNFLLGATVKAGFNSFVTCAPRNAQIFKPNREARLTILGLCFDNPTNGTPRLLDTDTITAERMFKPYGWSLEVTKTNEIIIGAPPVFDGRVKVVKNNKFQELKQKGVWYSFGYSVASGNYFDEYNITSFYYAISTPFGTTGNGKVLFFNAQDLKQINKFTIYDYNLGSLFGASLCSVNLGDSRDSLMVGAPTYTKDNIIDHGAVYLYSMNNMKFILYKTIEGPSDTTAYFGYSLANLGDLDGDLKDEVAIGAPYEDQGRGAVYIYSGARLRDPNQNGNEMLIQRIQPEPNDRSFGFSLAVLQDYDENGCYELAVSAPESNNVALYRCFAYMTINLRTIFPTKTQLQTNQQDDRFVFQTCIDVKFPKKPEYIEEKINMQVKVSHQDVWFWTTNYAKTNTISYDVRITKEKNVYCNDVELTKRKTGNFEELMSYTIKASLIDNPRNISEFNSKRVLPSAESNLLLVSEESLADCKGQTCEPKLTLKFKSNTSNLYIVGSTSELSFSFLINNTGDTAYTACLLVQIKGAPLLHIPQGCTTENRENLKCTPVILLKKGVFWETGEITLDTRGLTSKNEKIIVSYTLYSRCNNLNSANHSGEEEYVLMSIIDGIKIERNSDPGDIVDIFSEASRVRHVYTITNAGPTAWEGVPINFNLTKKDVIDYENIIIEIEDERQVSCPTTKGESEDDLNHNCNYIDLKKDKQVKVIIPFIVTPMDGKSTDETQNVSTSLLLNFKTEFLNSSTITQLQFKKCTVPVWIIVTASLLGLLLFILLGYVLFSFGFLKRKKKGKLVALKKSVYRQSVQRASMRHSKRQSDEAKGSLLDQCTEPNQEQNQCDRKENEIL